MKRLISCLLCITILTSIMPISAFADIGTKSQPYTIDNGYIRVEVSGENGGFVINTEEGDLLKKSDNNKKLLFHNGKYDTSFVSFRVDYGNGKVEDYIFGGKYGGLSDPSRDGVRVDQQHVNGEIVASWSVGKLTFIQNISLANEASNEHGMVSIQLAVNNDSGTSVNVKARILLDSCLGEKDFVYYQVVKDGQNPDTITTEQIIKGEDYKIPQNFYAMDDPLNAEVMAYSVNNPSGMPYQIAFGHWNSLASTLFDFVPKEALNFTNTYNEYLTADSAYALYYDIGEVAKEKSLLTYYGVYSRHKVPVINSVAVDVTVPMRLELNSAKTGYERLSNVGIADFSAGVVLENYQSDTATDIENIALSIKTTANLRALGDNGLEIEGRDFKEIEPLNINYSNVSVGETISKTLYFEANPSEDAAYERITISVYDMSAGEIADDKKIGEKIVYVLLPGSDGGVPKVNFSSMTPEIIYTSGIRHLFVAITNPSMLDNRSNWDLYAYTVDGKTRVEIPHSRIRINDGIMDVAISDDIELAPGSWYLQLEWTDAAVSSEIVPEAHQKQTSSQLNFVVSEDKEYKNDSYGVLCVVEYNIDKNIGKKTEEYTHDSMYRLEAFEDEAAFKKFSDATDNYVEILLIFRGEFTADRKVITDDYQEEVTYYSGVSTKDFDPKTREYSIDNTITINGCMDFEDGTIAVYYESYKNPEGFRKAPILVEFDGDLLTSDARTSVWKGKAIFTKIEQGTSYSLRPYDENGNRLDNFNDETIQLIWPSVYGLGQTLAGMIFKLAYGELGVVKEKVEDKYGKEKEVEIGRVLSFTASFSKSFLNPKEGDKPRDTYWTKMQDIFEYHKMGDSLYKTVYGEDKYNAVGDLSTVNESDDDEKGFSASVMVQDVLFGCGKGFYGVNFKVDLSIQNYIDNLPKLEGSLEVNTINNWAFKFEGGMELPNFLVEAKLSFKSRNNIPVPDDIYFYVGNFKPGINIDGHGVIWITGGGGGISNLYDTIFLTKAVPPLKLIMSLGFSIVQMLDARATVSLGPTGIGLSAKDVKILNFIKVIPKISLGLEWYPGIELKGSMTLNLFQGIIKGGGYIVLIGKDYTDWFFEMYANARIKIPESVALVGGMDLLSIDLGLNAEKIWGGFEVLAIDYGITYYWGESEVNFTKGGNKAKPTFPDLLGQKDMPVYYDAERDQTLYAHFGTNISPPVIAEIIDLSMIPRLMDESLSSASNLKLHRFNLGTYDSDKAAIVQISYNADNKADAEAKAGNFEIKNDSGSSFPIKLFNDKYAGNAPENANANANITFNETTGTASYCFTVTDSSHYNKDWYISTGDVASNVLLYNVNPLPKVKTVSGTVSGSEINLSWEGSSLDELDKISFFLTDSNEPNNPKGIENLKENEDPEEINNPKEFDGGILLTIIEDSDIIKGKSKQIEIPKDIPSGKYYIRAVYSKEDEVNGVVFSGGAIEYTNTNTPGKCVVNSFVPAGNLEYRLTIEKSNDSNTDGYQVSIYNEDGTPTDIINLPYDKAVGDTTFNIGGGYEYEGEAIGLTGGKSYYAVVVPYNLIDSNNNGEMDTVVYGQEVKTEVVKLPLQTTPKINISSDEPETIVKRIEQREEETVVEYITYRDKAITLTASADQAVTGKWSLDDALIEEEPIEGGSEIEKPKGVFTDTREVTIPLNDLTEGNHTLEITGSNAQGDNFRYSYVFVIDTTPPRLMLTTPVNGSFFGEDGKLLVSGVTDSDAHFTIVSDEVTICSGLTIAELRGIIDSEGVFQFTVDIPDPNNSSKRDLTFSVSDAVGNTVTKNVGVTHGGLGDLNSLQVLVDGRTLLNGNIPAHALGELNKQLYLSGVTSNNTLFRLSGNDNVSWHCQTVQGNASVDENGLFTIGPEAQGMLVGQLEVTKGAYRTAAMTFGLGPSLGTVDVSYNIGGTVTGGGDYLAGENVTLIAIPNKGYMFSRWVIEGATVKDNSKATITFVMPEKSNVTAYAEFKPIPSAIDPTPSERDSTPSKTDAIPPKIDPIPPKADPIPPKSDRIYTFKEIDKVGELVKTEVPAGINPDTFVAYYLDEDGNKIYVTVSAVRDGVLYFNAPVSGKYFFVDNNIDFKDTESHWAEPYIKFMVARGLFLGTGENNFAPNETMTRAMFVTVLHRLAGQLKPKNPVKFQDIPEGTWYEKAVAWASENGIVNGISQNSFAPNELLTREEMCALIARYARFIGIAFDAGDAEGKTDSFIDADAISGWATDDVAFCKAMGIVTGLPDNSFAPKSDSNRGENCAVFMRLIELLIKQVTQ